MKFLNILSDSAVTEELGCRLTAARLERRMTQAEMAEAAGVSKRTVERLEDGGSVQLTNLIRCLRVLGMLEGLERLAPETPANPIDQLKRRGAQRVRVRRSKAAPAPRVWSWSDSE